MDPKSYYDDFADRQVRVGVNDRHRAIMRWLTEFGLAPGMDVLEIGCGVGTQTELVADHLRGSGRLLAIDLSPKSVALARARLAEHSNVDVQATDILDLQIDQRFDAVVMPDVIEHIPLERHFQLFAKVRGWLKDTGFVLVHIPNPFYLEWCRRHEPQLLQVVDQPIFTETLLANVQPNGFYLHYLKTYSIWIEQGDYQVIVLKPRRDIKYTATVPPPSLRTRLRTWLGRG